MPGDWTEGVRSVSPFSSDFKPSGIVMPPSLPLGRLLRVYRHSRVRRVITNVAGEREAAD